MGVHVLIAEDDPPSRELLALVLTASGATITAVGDGRAALDAWTSGAHDIVLLDLQMPVLDGISAAKAIRAAEESSGRDACVIVGVTAHTTRAVECKDAGMDAVAAKPIDVSSFSSMLRTALDARRG
jgi:CheY-like chemotaxis protein